MWNKSARQCSRCGHQHRSGFLTSDSSFKSFSGDNKLADSEESHDLTR